MVMKNEGDPRKFFTSEEKNEIVSAIRDAEKKTSGEIRVYLERKSSRDLMKRAFSMKSLSKSRSQLSYGRKVPISIKLYCV